MLIKANQHAIKTTCNISSMNTLYRGWLLDKLSACIEQARVIVSHFSLKGNDTGSDTLYDVQTRTMLPKGREGNRSQLCSGVHALLTLYENTHIPTAEVDVIGNLTPVNSRVIPLEGTQEEQSAVYHFHPFRHFSVQSAIHKRQTLRHMEAYNQLPISNEIIHLWCGQRDQSEFETIISSM